MAATYHHARRLYIGTTAEMAAAAVVLGVDSIGTEYWDTTVSALYIWDGAAWVPGFAALPHDILSATHGDTTPAAVVRGDLMTGQGVAPLWARLAHPGFADRVLQSTATEITWSAQVLILTGSLQVGANTLIGGGGALALGGFIFTVPATGTGVIGGGAGAANRVAYWTDANTLASDAGLFVDAANDLYLVADGGGIGNSAATARLVFDSSGATDYAYFSGCFVGAGIAVPEALVHIYIGDSGRAPNVHTALFVEDSDFTFIEVAAGTTGWSGIYFSDAVTDRKGRFEYDHTNSVLNLYNNTHRFRMFGNGNVSINAAAALGKLHVDQSSVTGAIPVLHLDQADLSEEFIELATTVGAGNPIDTTVPIAGYYGKMRVSVAGVGHKYIPLYDT